jgi:hypothetical protein
MTPAQRRVLETAALREYGNVCPTPGLHNAAQTLVLRSLRRKGLIAGETVPKITDAGRLAIREDVSL